MSKRLRYGDYLGTIRHRQRRVSYNEVVAHRPKRLRLHLRPLDLYRLLAPYWWTRFYEQVRAVVPLGLFLALFQTVVLHDRVDDPVTIVAGLAAVILGLMWFMEGVKYGLMPFSENIGYLMPARSTLPSVLAVAFLLGAGATLAEPAIGALKAAGSITDPKSAPYLYLLLNDRSRELVMAVGLGVGASVAVGMLRLVFNWPMKWLIVVSLIPCLGLTAYLASRPELAPILGLAWDCGGITTGPVTVPLVLAIGIGMAAASGNEDNPLAGFGIVTLASLFPVLGVMVLGLTLVGDPVAPVAAAPVTEWHGQPPFADVLGALRAIVPLVAFLWFVQAVWLKERVKHPGLLLYGIAVALVGMTVFNLGLTYGLNQLGSQTGAIVPAAFAPIDGPPIYPYAVGVVIALGFAALLGFGATVAEPALNAMGSTVQNLTDGAFPKALLIRAVALGVGLGTALGVAKIVFNLPIVELLLPAYGIALMMTLVSSEEYVALAWDSAGVTTGPVTVPLVLALGLALGKAVGAPEGFGILAMASAGPIITVLAVGLWIQYRTRRATGAPETAHAKETKRPWKMKSSFSRTSS